MARLEPYRQYTREVMQRHGSHRPAYGEVELQLIFNTEHNHYQLIHTS